MKTKMQHKPFDTEEQAFEHLRVTFELACRHHPDLMEQYSVMLAEHPSMEDQIGIMRRGLRETFNRRIGGRREFMA